MGISWYVKRLEAMGAREIAWRVGQKARAYRERRRFSGKAPVYEVRAFGDAPAADLRRLGLNFQNRLFAAGSEVELLGGYPYGEYRTRWHAAFQTPGDWPVRFAADYSFSADGVPGDIRTNWELNRHRQFAVLAKSYYATGDAAYLDELAFLFDDWNAKNPFMWGPEWASPMEESIRLINWLVAAAFLEASGDGAARPLRERLCAGARAMAAHVRLHYSRYSSANNHTVVEAAGVAVAAAVFGEGRWLWEALALLESEVAHQTYPDGVNKEQALHYQLFVMEALCLVSHVLRASGEALSAPLASQLRSMSRYARACCVGNGRYVEFGDDDEGVILDLGMGRPCYPEYVLALASLELGGELRWAENVRCCETVLWLYGNDDLGEASSRRLAEQGRVESFPHGGTTIMRFCEGRGVLAFDHGPLGLGPLCAHGHADALSVQLFVDAEPVLVDPGTYVYNGNPAVRDRLRSTRAHNTVCVGGENQSEALGPFLWGRTAQVSGFSIEETGDEICVAASHDGYEPARVRREVRVRGPEVVISDTVEGAQRGGAVACWHFSSSGLKTDGASTKVRIASGGVVHVENDVPAETSAFEWSPSYGVLAEGAEVSVAFDRRLTTTLTIAGGCE